MGGTWWCLEEKGIRFESAEGGEFVIIDCVCFLYLERRGTVSDDLHGAAGGPVSSWPVLCGRLLTALRAAPIVGGWRVKLYYVLAQNN